MIRDLHLYYSIIDAIEVDETTLQEICRKVLSKESALHLTEYNIKKKIKNMVDDGILIESRSLHWMYKINKDIEAPLRMMSANYIAVLRNSKRAKFQKLVEEFK